MSSTDALPYELPETPRRKIGVLAEIVDIPRTRFLDVSDKDALKALSGLILYRHLDRQKEREVNRHWATLPQPLQMSLRKQRNFALVNPNWGIWSLSTEELENQHDWVQSINNIAQLLGLGGLSIAQFKKVLRFLEKGRLAGVAALLLAGTFLTVKNLEGRKIDAEMVRRLKEEGEL
ncbi:hypothetical protein CK501_01140 [Halovibrio salipaludis]|uniref:Uncharacterized protein n=1 Tax=Halovibrio salipaludis TaxID=2032626 RepID=A0A2A2FAS8_9GAMM|nr:hypothetical protein [Halovibrio salipaludis]PAU81787.1 hypothetical protein CK501_01140 [Halovibrio salipaludis]